ncbi:MAG: Maf family protein [Anaerovoracaceae bacterium]|nr:Maf family protein [Anaerovoracaceae bacterium]
MKKRGKVMMNIVLASGSPRRIEIMRAHGIEPLVMPADIEENIPKVHGMCETVMFLALKKAQDVAGRLSSLADCTEEGSIIVAADTIVYKDGEIMGKPADRADAFRMLDKLRNDFHYVVTGVALLSYGRQLTRVFAEVTKVYFEDYQDSELEAYLDTDEAYDKAGAYAIQGYFAKHIDHIEGSYDNVIGFPWDRIEKEILKMEEK